MIQNLLFKIILVLLLIASPAYAAIEQILNFDEESLPILNENFRQLQDKTFEVKSSSDDAEPGYLDNSILNITVIGSVTDGEVAGFAIDATSLTSGSGATTVGLDSGGVNPSIYCGSSTPASAPFRVTNAGVLTATSGTVGAFTLGTDRMSAGTDADYIGLIPGTGIQMGDSTYADAEFSVTNAGVLKAVSGTIGGCTLATTSIGSTTFASGPLGSGWNISNTGEAEFNNIRARGKITTSVFEKDTVSSIGGNFLVSDSDILDADMTALDASTLTVSGDTTFAVNDILRIKDGVDDEWLLVTNAGSAPTYTVTRDVDAQYAADTNPIWKAGTAVVNYGASGEGLIFMTASESNAPYISVVTHAGAPYDTLTTRMRMGNLNGYLGYATDLYGMGIGSSDANQANLTYDPTNGLRLRTATTDKIVLDNSGNVYIGGTVTIGGASAVLASTLDGWKHASDATKIDGGDIYTGTVTADKITAGTFIGGNFVIGSGGAFQSDNYVADTSGFRLNHEALELNSGTTILGEGILETIMIYAMVFGGE